MNIIKDYPCNAANYSKRTGKIKYIVIHYVGATGSAKDNAMYYNREKVGASAHFFVGHANENGAVYQSVDPAYRAWHCGSETGKYVHADCRNDNSIGVELCCKYINTKGWYFEDETVNAAIELVRELMQAYNIPASNVLRHYDVTHKNCPAPFVEDEAAWTSFKTRLGIQEYTNANDIVWELQERGIVTDASGMLAELRKHPDGRLYWLARKAVQYIREQK